MKESIWKSIGKRIQQARKEKGLKAEDLAQIMGIPVRRL